MAASRREIARTARSMRRHARRVVDYDRRDPIFAEVTGIGGGGFYVDLHGSRLELGPDALTLTQWVKRYDRDHTIVVGDTLLVHRVGESSWLATDVVSDKDLGTAP